MLLWDPQRIYLNGFSLSLRSTSPLVNKSLVLVSRDLTCVPLLQQPTPLFFECQLTHNRTERLCQFAFYFVAEKKKNKKHCQYEMTLDEASPELAVLVCSVPDELDLRMCGSR